jgi:CBS domain-containing protein
LPKGQDVLTVEDTTPAWDAIDRMIDNGYSQLPVTAGGRVVGVFTWRSFGKRVTDLRRSTIKAVDLPVRECMEPARFIDPEVYIDKATDWSDIDYVLVGCDTKLLGILAVADVFARLNDFAEAFVLIYEVEQEVRDLIVEMVTEAGLPPLIANMKVPENTRPLQSVKDFTFDQYRGLICCKANWPSFERAFTSVREVVDEDFKQVSDLRNTVFHFRRGVTARDTDRLRRFRDALRYGRDLWRRISVGQQGVAPCAK